MTPKQMKAARALLGWNQHELARQAGMSQTGIARIENGENKPYPSTVQKITSTFQSNGVFAVSWPHYEGVIKITDDETFHVKQRGVGE